MGASTTGGAPRYTSRDLGLLGIVAVAWGVAYIFIRQGIVAGAAPLPYAAARYALSAVGFAAIAALRGERRPRTGGLLVSAVVGGILVIGCYGGFLYSGEQYTSGGYASVLSTTAPILTVVVALFLLPGERLGRWSLTGVVVGFVGAVLLVVPSLAGGPGGDLLGPPLVLSAFVSAAFGTVLLRRYGGGPQGLWQIGTQFAVGAALLGAASVAVPGEQRLPLTTGVLAPLTALVLVSSLVGYFGYFALHHRVGPIRANSVAYLLPLVGLAVGTGVYGEPLTVWEVGGCVVVLVGVTLIVRESLRRPPPATGVPPLPQPPSHTRT